MTQRQKIQARGNKTTAGTKTNMNNAVKIKDKEIKGFNVMTIQSLSFSQIFGWISNRISSNNHSSGVVNYVTLNWKQWKLNSMSLNLNLTLSNFHVDCACHCKFCITTFVLKRYFCSFLINTYTWYFTFIVSFPVLFGEKTHKPMDL